MKIEIFLNSNIKILKYLSENETDLKDEKFVLLSQNGIAKELGMSKGKINSSLNLFIENGLLEMISSGKYKLTDEAKRVLKYLDI